MKKSNIQKPALKVPVKTPIKVPIKKAIKSNEIPSKFKQTKITAFKPIVKNKEIKVNQEQEILNTNIKSLFIQFLKDEIENINKSNKLIGYGININTEQRNVRTNYVEIYKQKQEKKENLEKKENEKKRKNITEQTESIKVKKEKKPKKNINININNNNNNNEYNENNEYNKNNNNQLIESNQITVIKEKPNINPTNILNKFKSPEHGLSIGKERYKEIDAKRERQKTHVNYQQIQVFYNQAIEDSIKEKKFNENKINQLYTLIQSINNNTLVNTTENYNLMAIYQNKFIQYLNNK